MARSALDVNHRKNYDPYSRNDPDAIRPAYPLETIAGGVVARATAPIIGTVGEAALGAYRASRILKTEGPPTNSAVGSKLASRTQEKTPNVSRPAASRSVDARIANNRASHESYKNDLRANMERPTVKDPNLDSLIGEHYRPNAKEGSGSTAAALRSELTTGKPVGNRFHSKKARDGIVSLEKWLNKNPTASPGDRAAAENVIKDMRNAIDGR